LALSLKTKKELTIEQAKRYRKASKKEKSHILEKEKPIYDEKVKKGFN
jgi:hypothetical protein